MTIEILHEYEHATIVDCHSFPDIPLNRDLIKELPRPDFCIGIDEYHTPKKLSTAVMDLLLSSGYKVLINNPYAGTIIPMKYYKQNKNVTGLMIEVNRKLYMTNSNGVALKNESFENICKIIKNIFHLLKDS